MREIKSHKVNGLNDAIRIKVLDAPGAGGASHKYGLVLDIGNAKGKAEMEACEINFQNGPINEFGVNGISNEALLAVVIDRLQSFQAGDFKCRENAIALTKLEEAMHWLQHRTQARVARGVEGTNQR